MDRKRRCRRDPRVREAASVSASGTRPTPVHAAHRVFAIASSYRRSTCTFFVSVSRSIWGYLGVSGVLQRSEIDLTRAGR